MKGKSFLLTPLPCVLVNHLISTTSVSEEGGTQSHGGTCSRPTGTKGHQTPGSLAPLLKHSSLVTTDLHSTSGLPQEKQCLWL